jgi:small GTP-binding protein
LSDGSVVNCLIYDTAGQERFNSINETYYKKADAVLLVYDITNKESFELIRNYYCPKIKEFCRKKIPIILLGNKTDLEKERVISMEDGIALSVEYKFKFCQTSCLKNENVADAFEALIELWNFENQNKINGVSLRKRPNLKTIIDSEYISPKGFKRMNTSRYNSVVLDDNYIEEKSFKIIDENKDKSKTKKKKKKFC